MKIGLILLGTLIILWLLVRPVEAAQLMYIRVGEHKTFTRIVFEFQGPVRFKNPVIKGSGKLSVVFLDSTTATALPFQELRERTKQVDAIEFIQQGSHLTANIALYSPYFKLKPFYLFSPDRVVLDVYWLNAPPSDTAVELKKSIHKKLPERVLMKPVAKSESLSSFPKYVQLQTYLLIVLVVLNVLIVVTIAFLSFILLQKKRSTDSANRGGILDSLKTTDESTVSIDSRIKEELEKHDQY